MFHFFAKHPHNQKEMSVLNKEQFLLLEATIMVLSDWPTELVDALLMFGRAKGDDNKRYFETAVKVWELGLADHLLINGSDGERLDRKGKAWAGKEEWTEKLLDLGVERESIDYFPAAYTTPGEAQVIIPDLVRRRWKTAAIYAQPHQALRCMAGLVRAMQTQNQWLKIYCITPKTCDWFETTCGSQGEMPMPRHKHIFMEYQRIDRDERELLFPGHVKDDLATPQEIFTYYQKRETL